MAGPSPHSSKRVRMRDVANRCGVSISTVSLVLSGDNRIPEDTTRRVLQAVKAMEYRPSILARSLARRSSRTIGVILPEFAFTKNKAYYYETLQAIHIQTQPAGYKLVVEAANAVFLSRRYYLRLLKEQSADGMIYLAASLKDDFLKDMEKEPYPFVLLGNSSDGIDLPVVKSDDEKAASLAAQHLINLGHKKIAYVGGLAGYSMGLGRNRGFQNTMKEAGLEVQNTLLLDGNFSLEESERLVQTIVDQKATAILCASDSMAFGILRGLRNLGISVPSDMALVGMDDLEMSSWIEPSLTTVRTHIQEVAGAAAKYLIQKIQALPTQKLQFKEIPTPELIVRSSCGSKK